MNVRDAAGKVFFRLGRGDGSVARCLGTVTFGSPFPGADHYLVAGTRPNLVQRGQGSAGQLDLRRRKILAQMIDG